MADHLKWYFLGFCMGIFSLVFSIIIQVKLGV